MQDMIDIEAWKQDGQELWCTVEKNKLVVLWWNNPWFRMATIGVFVTVFAVVLFIFWKNLFISILLGIIAIPYLFSGIKFLLIGKQTGGLYSFFTEYGFGIGCDADRLMIPYSQIEVPEYVDPSTVNQNYIVLPVITDPQGILIETKDGNEQPWDGNEYRRGIASIEFNKEGLIARAYPNEMVVQLFGAIHSLSIYFKDKE